MRISELIIFLISLKSKNEMKSRMVVIFYRNQSNLIYFKIKKSQIFQKLIFQKKRKCEKEAFGKIFQIWQNVVLVVLCEYGMRDAAATPPT